MQRAVGFTHLADAVVHPCAAAFVFTRIEIQIETAAQFVFLVIQLEETHFRMPDINIGTFFGGDAINTFHHFKQAVYGFVLWEVRAQLFIADAVQMLFLFFAVVGDVPRLQVVDAKFSVRKCAQLCQLFFALRTRTFCQIG
ncbi:hypothetical protein D3C78_1227560 [compost metagenome]